MTVWRRFARFNAVSAAGILVQVAAIWILVDLAGMPYLPATVGAVSLAVVHNFLWHRLCTWGDRRPVGADAVTALARFALVNGVVSLVGNVVVMTLLVSGLGLHVVPASIVAIGLCGLLNFCLADRVVFKDRPSPAHQRHRFSAPSRRRTFLIRSA